MSTTPHLIVIAPDVTKIDDEYYTPCSISVVLENGHSYDIDVIVNLLEKHDKKVSKIGRIKKPGRIKRFARAFKQAVKESTNEETAPSS